MSLLKRTIRGHEYVGPVIFRVIKEDAFGRPTEVEIGWNDSVFNLKGGEKFFTGYISETALEGAINPRGGKA